VLESRAAFEPAQQTAGAGHGFLGLLSLLFQSLRALATQLLHPRTDGREIIGSTGSSRHVSSSKFGRTRIGLEWFMSW
jgi:hypothetical protein